MSDLDSMTNEEVAKDLEKLNIKLVKKGIPKGELHAYEDAVMLQAIRRLRREEPLRKAPAEEITPEPSKPSGIVNVIYFHAKWCSPCKMQDPIYDNLKNTAPPGVKFKTIDVDSHEKMKEKYDIKAIPIIVFEADDKIIIKRIGVTSLYRLQNDLREAIRALIDGVNPSITDKVRAQR